MYNFRRLTVIWIIFSVLFIVGPAFCEQASRIEVSVSGIEDELLDNVRAALTLTRQQQNRQQSEPMTSQDLEKAEEEIRTALEPFGYYSPSIDTNISRDGGNLTVKFQVSPGKPVQVAEVQIQVTGPGKDNPVFIDLNAGFPLHKGDILDHRQYKNGKNSIISKAIRAGYRDAEISRSIIRVDREQYSARISLTLQTGPYYTFGATTFEADFLDKDLLNRMLPYEEGDTFSPRKIVELRQSFLNSGYFNTVEVETEEPPAGQYAIPVSVILEPQKPNSYRVGIGYGTDTGVRGSLDWTNQMLNRQGHQLNLKLQPSERKSNFQGTYTIPVFDPKTNRVSLFGKWEWETFEETESKIINAGISYDYITEHGEYSGYLEFLDEDYEIGLESGHATLFKPGALLTWRFADSRLKTTRGILVSLDLTGARENVFSDVSFLQASIYSKAIYSFFEKWRFIGRLQLGGTLVDSISDLPPSLRYFAGGDQSVRGFSYKSIGPTDAAGNVVGGTHLIVYSLELERMLFGNWSAAVFFDSGDATNSLNELNMKRGVGGGIRWNLPFGQVRLDLANGVSESDSSWRIHFNVSADL